MAVLLAVLSVVFVFSAFGVALCVAAGRGDRQMDEAFREYIARQAGRN